jgi:hypothetical protein
MTIQYCRLPSALKLISKSISINVAVVEIQHDRSRRHIYHHAECIFNLSFANNKEQLALKDTDYFLGSVYF